MIYRVAKIIELNKGFVHLVSNEERQRAKILSRLGGYASNQIDDRILSC